MFVIDSSSGMRYNLETVDTDFKPTLYCTISYMYATDRSIQAFVTVSGCFKKMKRAVRKVIMDSFVHLKLCVRIKFVSSKLQPGFVLSLS